MPALRCRDALGENVSLPARPLAQVNTERLFSAMRAWLVTHERALGHSESQAYSMVAEMSRVKVFEMIEKRYEGGTEAFIAEHSTLRLVVSR